MNAKQLIAELEKLPPNTNVLVSNGMSCPFYDYEGQRAEFRVDAETKTIRLLKEVEGNQN